jgi:hypothetical protein
MSDHLWKTYQKVQFRTLLDSQQDSKCRPNVFYGKPTPIDPNRYISDEFRFHYYHPFYSLYRPSENMWEPYISNKITSGMWSCNTPNASWR